MSKFVVKYKRHYEDHQQEFDDWVELERFLFKLEHEVGGYAERILEDGKTMFYREIRGETAVWIDAKTTWTKVL